MYLSLPLPSIATRTMTVTVFYGDGSGLPTQYTVTILKHGCCKDLDRSPLEPLPSIKDDEHIVAYRLPKRAMNYIIGITLEQKAKKEGKVIKEVNKGGICLSNNFKGSERKLFLTPLVTYLEDTQTGADIDLAISRVLSPLRKKTYFSSTIVHSGQENGSAVKAIDESANIYATHSRHETDNRELNCMPISKDSLIKTGQLVKVMLDWTDKEHKLYDSSYLKDVPEVHKTKLTVKKTRQEAISLFSCLDAFLKEEPLGPNDMW
ncbi:Ubiquitin carboxyl-terminal hydrolase 9 [Camellia lanceoleosa]|uniref:Ubiquitin carboxyl-terminal hydrolase 9 n=1 Tax=Camellia lanceoleosa TaxID=1840588 RepID=A0ACC0GG35_9ERIC|nr:Ubiquitin carboxyl-terminal hydrolase 9 [Camellia lanceoleosa]